MKKCLLLLALYLGFTLGAQAQNDPFITVWETTRQDTITIPTFDSSSSIIIFASETANTAYDFTIDWGDGTVETYQGQDPDPEHIYTSAGRYEVSITGTFPQMQLNFEEDASKLKEVKQWGDIAWESMERMFAGATNMTITASDVPDLSRVSSMAQMFRSCLMFNTDISSWDVAQVTDMSGVFMEASIFNQDIGNWDVSSVTNMNSMFSNAEEFNQNLNNWNTSSVTNMGNMFIGSGFNGDISNWDVSSVFTMAAMFRGAVSFNQDIDTWDLANVRDMRYMFAQAYGFNQNLSNWDVSSVTQMEGMFEQTNFNQDIGNWNVSSVTSMARMFERSAFNQDIGSWDVSSVASMSRMFNETGFNQDIGNWDVSSVRFMASMFAGSVFDQDIGDWNVANVEIFNGFMANAELSTANYDSLLIGWSNKSLLSGLTLDVNSQYSSAAASARQQITDQYNWAINDNGQIDAGSTNSRVAYYTFDDGTATDFAGDNDGTINGATRTEDRFGDAGKALSFDGLDDYIDFGDKSAFRMADSSFSISTWFKFDERQRSFLLGKRGLSNNFNQYSLIIGNGNTNSQLPGEYLGLFIRDGNGTNLTGSYKQLDRVDSLIGDWHHVVLSFDAKNRLKLFIDNELRSDLDLTSDAGINFGELDVEGSPFVAGRRNNEQDWHFKGSLDEVGVYNYALSKTEVDDLYGSYHPGAPNKDTTFTIVIDPTQSNIITIPTIGGTDITDYDFTIDWGDGTVEQFSGDDPDPTHTFGAGTYEVKISGTFPAIHYNSADDVSKASLKEIRNWGNIQWETFNEAFMGASNMNLTATDAPDLSNVTTLRAMFRNCTSLNADLNHWDVSGIENFGAMFATASAFNGNITAWDVSSATNLNSLFYQATVFNQDIGQWDVSSVTNMDFMLNFADNFDQDVGGWDVSNVTSFRRTFLGTPISSANYDSLLIGWSQLQLQPDLSLNIGAQYSKDAESARQKIIDDFGWTINDGGLAEPTSIEDELGGDLPTEIALKPNYPNPFNPSTTISYDLPASGHVQLTVYDMLGRQVAQLVNMRQNAGTYTISFDASRLSSGIYLYRLNAGTKVLTRKMTLIK